MAKTPNRALPIGTNVATAEPVSLGLARLSEHVDICGPTGCGKTQSVMLPLFQQLAPMRDVSVVAMTCKGSFATMCADFAISHGLTEKLAIFKPGQTPLLGFNPLRRNGWPAERHAKIARTSVLASRGEHSVDQMPQLSRLLFLALAVALEQNLTLVEAARLLRPGRSALRSDMLRSVESEFLRESLAWFDSLKDPRQDELAASTLSRLENFVSDPLIRGILTESNHCVDIGDVIENNRKLCIDVGFYNPLVPDDARTMARLLLNSILAHKFSTPKEEQTTTVLLLDEVQEYATEDLAVALTLGRELKLYVVMAHQFPSQLKLSAENSHLFEAVQHCCRTKIVFGGMHVHELKEVVEELMIDQFDPLRVKDERTSLELEPFETTRETVTRGVSAGTSLGSNNSTSSATSCGTSRGRSSSTGAGESWGASTSSSHVLGSNEAESAGETLLPNGEIISITHEGAGVSEADLSGESSTEGFNSFTSTGTQQTTSVSEISGQQTGTSQGSSETNTVSVSTAPFYEYIKRWVVSSRTFQSLEEFLTLALQAIKAQPKAHFVIKVPNHKAVFVRAHFIKDPWISKGLRQRALERIHGRLVTTLESPLAVVRRAPYQLTAPMLEFTEPPPPTFKDEE